MGGDFGHFLTSAEMNGEGGGMFGKERGEPSLVFFDTGVAKSGFDGNWQTERAFDGVFEALYSEIGSANHGGAATSGVNVTVGTAKIEVDARKTEFFERGRKFRKMSRIFAPNLGNNRGVGGRNLQARKSIASSLFGGKRRDVGEFGEKEVWASGGGNDTAEGLVGYAFHGSKAEKGLFEGLPDVLHGNIITHLLRLCKLPFL